STAPGRAEPSPDPKAPGLGLIALVTIVLGPFGAVPAAAAASSARRQGLPVLRYWVSFLVVWVIHLVVLLLLAFSWLGGGFSPHPGSAGGTSSTAAAPSSAVTGSIAPSTPASSSGAPHSSLTPSSPSPSVAASFPASASSCSQNVAVNSMTSCQFASRVSDAYRAAGSPASASLVVSSPVTGSSYTMACTAASTGLVSCSGGNNAVVYLR
ncbi:MAG: hypothetical protein WAX29_00735, partial [Propionibacterium sp.]